VATEKLLDVGLKLIVVGFVIFIGRVVWRYFIFGAARNIVYRTGNDLYNHLQTLPQNYFINQKTGDLMARFTSDLDSLRMAIGPGLMMAVDGIIMTGFVLLSSFLFIDPILTLVAIIPLPIIGIGGFFFGKSLQIRFKEKQEAFSKLTDFILESFSGIRVIKAFVMEPARLKEFNKVNDFTRDKNIAVSNAVALLFPLVEVISGLSYCLAIIIGGYMTVKGYITIGNFIAFNQLIGLLIWPMVAIGWSLNIFSQGIASLDRINAVLDQKNDIIDGYLTPQINNDKIEIIIKDLTFSYPKSDRIILNGINLTINSGCSIGITGRTGAGKTALIDLITRLYDPPRNTIFVNGIDILDIKIAYLRATIGVVTQEHYLFSKSISDNIRLSDPDADIEAVESASIKASLHENVSNFPGGYDTIIGEKGVTLSGGQKQRLSIARSLLGNPSVLIFDDSLSAVDSETEAQLLNSLRTERKGKTTIIISHRLSAIRNCDTIIVLDEGKIVESGIHKELIKTKGLYHSMFNRQLIESEIEKA